VGVQRAAVVGVHQQVLATGLDADDGGAAERPFADDLADQRP
jgi:hypothetical protein